MLDAAFASVTVNATLTDGQGTAIPFAFLKLHLNYCGFNVPVQALYSLARRLETEVTATEDQGDTKNARTGITAAARRSFISNPQPNPHDAMSCATSANFGSPRGLLSRCKTESRYSVTAEAAGSSPVVPAIPFNLLARLRNFSGTR